jgi:hypothetical protein
MQPTRVLFVGRSIVHFSLFQSVITALLDRGAEVELIFHEKESRNWKGGDLSVIEDYVRSHPGLRVGWLRPRQDRLRKLLFTTRELRTYRNYLTRHYTTPFYVNRARRILGNALSAEWRARLETPRAQRLLRSGLAELALRTLEAFTPPDAGILDFLETRRPDLVILSPLNMRFSEETDYLKAAKRLGIPSVLYVLTWDNLSTKGLIQIMPDLVCLWNELQHRDAVDIHNVPSGRIRMTGAPFFDPWFVRPADLLSREEFCAKLGFQPDRKILLYLGSSFNIAPDEPWFVEAARAALDASADPALRECQLLVRPHFGNPKGYDRLPRDRLVVWPEAGALPERQDDLQDMQNSFFHADATLCINSSAMIISILLGLPTFSVRIPKYSETQANSVHFRHLEELGAMHYCENLDAFVEGLSSVWKGRDDKVEARREFARRFARPHGLGRPAGDVVAEIALATAASQARF